MMETDYEQMEACVVQVPENPLKLKVRLTKSPIRREMAARSFRKAQREGMVIEAEARVCLSRLTESKVVSESDGETTNGSQLSLSLVSERKGPLENRNLFADFPKMHSPDLLSGEGGVGVTSLPGHGNSLIVGGGPQGEHCYDGSLQPSPKDSGVDMSSPIRTGEEVLNMEGSGNTTESGGESSPQVGGGGLSEPRSLSCGPQSSDLLRTVYPPCSVSQGMWGRPDVHPDACFDSDPSMKSPLAADTDLSDFGVRPGPKRALSEDDEAPPGVEPTDSGNESSGGPGGRSLSPHKDQGCSSPDNGSYYGAPPLLTPQGSCKAYVYGDNHSSSQSPTAPGEEAENWLNASISSRAPTLVSSHMSPNRLDSFSQAATSEQGEAPMFSASEEEEEAETSSQLSALCRSISWDGGQWDAPPDPPAYNGENTAAGTSRGCARDFQTRATDGGPEPVCPDDPYPSSAKRRRNRADSTRRKSHRRKRSRKRSSRDRGESLPPHQLSPLHQPSPPHQLSPPQQPSPPRQSSPPHQTSPPRQSSPPLGGNVGPAAAVASFHDAFAMFVARNSFSAQPDVTLDDDLEDIEAPYLEPAMRGDSDGAEGSGGAGERHPAEAAPAGGPDTAEGAQRASRRSCVRSQRKQFNCRRFMRAERQAASMRKKALKLCRTLFPGLAYARRSRRATRTVDTLVDQVVAALREKPRAGPLQAIPVGGRDYDVRVVLCGSPAACLTRLRRKVCRLLEAVLPSLQLGGDFDRSGPKVDLLLQEVVEANAPAS